MEDEIIVIIDEARDALADEVCALRCAYLSINAAEDRSDQQALADGRSLLGHTIERIDKAVERLDGLSVMLAASPAFNVYTLHRPPAQQVIEREESPS
ncbi:MAG TPA: hypothetical protein VFX20_13895 [Steroidobacteraceae bacterium]|nr:hypothetical protein [Steroidobacteraceae bacterium]